MADSPVGMWKLIELQRTADGQTQTNEQVHGFLVYTAEGWFTEAFQAQAPDGTTTNVIYCGTYEVQGDRLFHIPSIHTNPELVGTRLERGWEVNGDRFTLLAGTPLGSVKLLCDALQR
jgi:hypothetical protein